ncbi:hypothetical protein [Euryhalocaulis caribicus]|uniref:hypothetical protein n=1 Tax=Euryhalocaulis caribicus TaxID=1161401 RepID=UPI00039C56C8|nr:hypothetical protein [Euryhalocaulis caribicus]
MARRLPSDEKLKSLMQEKARIQNDINRLTARQMKSELKRLARRKFVAGEAVLNKASRDPKFARTLYEILDDAVSKRDRSLFGLDSEMNESFEDASRPRLPPKRSRKG